MRFPPKARITYQWVLGNNADCSPQKIVPKGNCPLSQIAAVVKKIADQYYVKMRMYMGYRIYIGYFDTMSQERSISSNA